MPPRWHYSAATLTEYHRLLRLWSRGGAALPLPASDEFEARLASAVLIREQENGYDLYRMAGSGRTHPRLRLLVRRHSGELARVLPETAHRPLAGRRLPER